jgi:peptidoglycan/LPS O-acetylase OafA/YrhL
VRTSHSSRDEPQAVTTAPRSLLEDRRKRMRTYLVAMGVRTVSFPLAVWALMSGWVVVGWILAAAAVLLPSVAVMLANAVDQRRRAAPPRRPTRALPAGGPVAGQVLDDDGMP